MRLIKKSMYLLMLSVSFLSFNSLNANELSVFPYGTFVPPDYMNPYDNRVYCDNGNYYGEFKIGVNDLGKRVVKELKLYENSNLLFTLWGIPGDDFAVSNSGYVVVYDLPYKEGGELTIRMFDLKGNQTLERKFHGASLFGFSPSGNKYGVGSCGKFEVFSFPQMQVQTFPPTHQFAISKDDALLAIARDDGISIYSEQTLLGAIIESMTVNYVRKIEFSDDNKTIAFIGKNKLAVYNTDNFSLRFIDEVSGYLSFTDLKITGSEVYTGIHVRNEETRMSHGIIRTYSLSSKRLTLERECAQASYMSDMSSNTYDYEKDRREGRYTVPWPFEPQDKSKMVWNGYCQNVAASTGTSGAYMHQGTDLDVSTKDRCVAVEGGITKCNLTLGGDLYWRIASCTVNVAERSNGWLYAHLVKSTITKQPGDKITKGEFLATIVPWTEATLVNGAHLHFAHISDKGTVWNVSDADEWDNEKNPMTYVRPTDDTKPPTFLDAFTNAKFAFTTNDNGSPQYIKTNELKGEVDVYAHIADIASGESLWEQPAHSLFYWIRCLDNGTIVLPRKVGLIMNQHMKGYGGAGASNDYTNLVPVMYRCDNTFPAIGWSDRNRHHLQNVTNSNGDSLVTVGHKKNALNTALYNDGKYRIYIEAVDAALNSAVDSMDVSFKNGISGINQDIEETTHDFTIKQIAAHANKLQITINIPYFSKVNLNLYNTQGALLSSFLSKTLGKGTYTQSIKLQSAPGIYLLTLETNNFSSAMRFVKVK